MNISDIFQGIGNSIGLYPDLVPITGSHHAAIFLCQLCFWTGKQRNPEGWIYKTQEEWQLETELSPKEQKTARSLLVDKGFIEERFVGIPRRLEYRVVLRKLNTLWDSWIPAMRIKFWLKEKLREEATLLSRGLADEKLEKVITILREGLTQARRTPENAESIEKSIIYQMDIMEETTAYPYSTNSRYKKKPNGDAGINQTEILAKTSEASLLYTENTQEITSEITHFPPTPPAGGGVCEKKASSLQQEKEGGEAIAVEVEIVSEEEIENKTHSLVESEEQAIQPSNLNPGEDQWLAQARDNMNLSLQKLNRINKNRELLDSGKVENLPRHEFNEVADYVIGPYVSLYRKSGKINTRGSVNDIKPEFLKYVEQKALSRELRNEGVAAKYVRNSELDYDRWESLIEHVKGWLKQQRCSTFTERTQTPKEKWEQKNELLQRFKNAKTD